MTPGRCGSWPFCASAPAEGDTFCALHRTALDNVIAMGGDTYKRALPPTVSVSHVPPNPQRRRVQRVHRDYRALIVAALQAGPLTSGELARAVETNVSQRTYSRVRCQLLLEGVIHDERTGRQRTYRLAA